MVLEGKECLMNESPSTSGWEHEPSHSATSFSLLNLLAPWVSVQAPQAQVIATFLWTARHHTHHGTQMAPWYLTFISSPILCKVKETKCYCTQSRCLEQFWEISLSGSSPINTFSFHFLGEREGRSFSFIVIMCPVSLSLLPPVRFHYCGENNSNLVYEKELVNVVNIPRSFV